MRVYIVCLLSLIFGWLPTFSTMAQFERFSIEQGLSQNTIMSIIQDSQGFLWLGTQDGLNRFDGHEFTVFEHDSNNPDSLSDDYILDLYEDESGYIWIGTQHGGLNRFDPVTESFVNYQHDSKNANSLSSNHIIQVTGDSQGSIWLATWDGGVTRFWPKAQRFERYLHNPADPKSLPHRIANDIVEDANHNIWVATYGGGLARFAPQINGFINYQHEPGKNGISSDMLWKLLANKDGSLWIATEGEGLDLFDPKTGRVSRFIHDKENPNSLSDNHVRTMMQDAQGHLWVGTFDGLSRKALKNNDFERFEHDKTDIKSISGQVIQDIYQTRDGIIWIGNFNDALNKYNPRHAQFGHIKRDGNNPDSLPSNNIRAIMQDRQGALWIGTDGEGLAQYDAVGNRYNIFKHQQNKTGSIASDRIWAVVEDSQDALWVGTFGNGVSRMDRTSNTFKNYYADPGKKGALQNHLVMSLLEDSQQNIWVGTYGGLHRYRPKTDDFEVFLYDPAKPEGLSDDAILSLMEDSKGNIWIGTYGGGLNVYLINSGKFKHFAHNPDDPTSISNNSPMATYEDPQGNIWVATYGGGLNKLNPDTGDFIEYSQAQGLKNASLYAVLPDDKGNLWLSSNDGLSMFDISTEQFVNYSPAEGVQSKEFNSGAFLKNNHGELFFGGINGINRFLPRNIVKQSLDMPVQLTQMRLFNEPISIDTANAEGKLYLTEAIGFTEALTLDYRDSLFSFEFAALDLSAPKHHRFAYMLENYDKKWIYTDHKLRRATYTNIPPGRYILKVKARTDDADWGNDVAIIGITITPAPWRTGWAYTGYILLIVIIVGSFVWQRYRKFIEVKQSQEQLSLSLWASANEMWDWNPKQQSTFSTMGFAGFDYETLKDTVHAKDLEGLLTSLQKIKDNQAEFLDLTYRVKESEGDWRWVRNRAKVVKRDATGSALRIIGTVADVHALQQAKDELQTLNQELEIRVHNRTQELTEAFNELKQTQAQLVESEKLASLGGLVVGVAHELNTPLGIATTAYSHVEHIVGDLCAQKNEGKLTRKGIDRFETDSIEGLVLLGKNLRRCAALVQQFKELAADERGKDTCQFNLLSLLGSIVQTVQQAMNERGIGLSIQCENSAEMHSHPGAFEKVVTQLIQNSLTHAFDDEKADNRDRMIQIKVEQSGDNTLFVYSDNGLGMSAENLELIFEPFYTSKRGSDCTGLGMLIVYNILVNQLAGTISCTSELGQGLTVTMTMPTAHNIDVT